MSPQIRSDISMGFIGALLVLILLLWLSPGGASDWIWEYYDDLRPVVKGRVENVVYNGSGIEFDLYSTKSRSCKYISANAYSIDSTGTKDHINLLRLDRQQLGVTHPAGIEIKQGRWRSFPVDDATVVEIWFTYRCSSRIVLAHAVDIAL